MEATTANSGTSYDEVPYESHPFPQSHPDRLATVATMAALKPPPVESCRVLELGCASGGNLLPLAVTLPRSQFLGIDLAQRQVSAGQQIIAQLGLQNIELRHLSILDVTAELGQFDYIICHGIYSWVPAEVQDKILTICKQQLTPSGVAYVSYNVYPGWHMRGIIRDMMCYHGNRFPTPQQRVAQARGLLDFVAKAVAGQPGAYGLLLKDEAENIRKQADYYLFHEHMESINEPLYFHQFAERAAARGLRYLGEAEPAIMVTRHFPRDVQETLHKIAPDLIRLEQYMDFLRNRMFRQTLLCHEELSPRYLMKADQIKDFLIASPLRPVAPRLNVRSHESEQFRGQGETVLTTSAPAHKAALAHLGQNWPRRVPFAELHKAVCDMLGQEANADPAPITEALGNFLLEGYLSTKLVELHVHAPPLATRVSERPLASPLARYQAAAGKLVTSLQHTSVALSKPECYVLARLDGNHDQATLLGALQELVQQGVLVLENKGQKETQPERLKTILKEGLEGMLVRFAQLSLLMG
jgi:methyltransferase-like protein/cyclopropane fatty-acyl-phospholipid synthase-like methyltransferase